MHVATATGLGTPRTARGVPFWMVATITAVSSVLASAAGASPTGQEALDVLIVAVTAATVVAAASAAHSDVVLVALIVSGAFSGTVFGAGLAVFTALAAVVPAVSVRLRTGAVARAAMAGVALNVGARSDIEVFLGASTLVAVGVGAVICISGLRRLPRVVRRWVAGAAAAVGVVVVAGSVALGISAATSMGALRAGASAVDDGLVQLGDGDLRAASESFAYAAEQFRRVEDRLTSPVTALAAAVPVVSQHRRVGTELSAAAAEASAALADQLETIDLGAVNAQPGRIDVDAIRAIEAPMRKVRAEVDRLMAAIEAGRNQWLAGPVDRRLDRLHDDLVAEQQRSDEVLDLLGAAPALFGAEETRTYFVAFTTASEVRGLGGFMGIWATMTIDDGRIEFSELNRVDGLASDAEGTNLVLDGPEEWLAQYGRYGFDTGPGGTVQPGAWGNVTMSPQVDATGEVIAQMYPAGGGEEIDGLLTVDIVAMSEMLRLVGPVTTSDGTVLTAESAPELLLHQQYVITDRPERTSLLEEVAGEVLDRLLDQPLPPPTDLIDVMGPMIEQGRLAGWSSRPEEQALFESSGFAGGLPEAGSGDGVAVTFNNAAGNKIDYFLRARAGYEVEVDAASGAAAATMLLEMENSAPSTGEADYVIENLVGLPTGTSQTLTTVYTTLPVDEVRLDGEVIVTQSGFEAGYFTTSMTVTLASGQVSAIEIDMSGEVDLAAGYRVVVNSPATAALTPVTADVIIRDGTDIVATESVKTEIGAARLSVPIP